MKELLFSKQLYLWTCGDNILYYGTLTRGMKLVLSGFGAGLTYGATVMTW